jgi:hypothetical protein
VLEGAELGHLDEQGKRRGCADAGDAHQDVEAGLQGRIGGELGVQPLPERSPSRICRHADLAPVIHRRLR